MPSVISPYVFVIGAAGFGVLLVVLAALAPRAWYGWTPTPRRLASRWRVEMGLTGIAIILSTAVALVVLAPQ
jgi:hypothetical protein